MKKDSDAIKRLFAPGKNIDLVFDIDTPSQRIRSASLYEHDHVAHKIIISQTRPPILSSFKYKAMQLTLLVSRLGADSMRIGMSCNIIGFKNNYQLSNKITENAIVLEYAPPAKQINVRDAYRLQPNPKYSIDGIITYRGSKFLSTDDFKIYDISLSGIGLVIPNIVKKQSNPLLKISAGDNAQIKLQLTDSLEETASGTMATFVEVVRKNMRFSKHSAFMGAKFCGLYRDWESTLGRFLHEAQLYDIKRI